MAWLPFQKSWLEGGKGRVRGLHVRTAFYSIKSNSKKRAGSEARNENAKTYFFRVPKFCACPMSEWDTPDLGGEVSQSTLLVLQFYQFGRFGEKSFWRFHLGARTQTHKQTNSRYLKTKNVHCSLDKHIKVFKNLLFSTFKIVLSLKQDWLRIAQICWGQVEID